MVVSAPVPLIEGKGGIDTKASEKEVVDNPYRPTLNLDSVVFDKTFSPVTIVEPGLNPEKFVRFIH